MGRVVLKTAFYLPLLLFFSVIVHAQPWSFNLGNGNITAPQVFAISNITLFTSAFSNYSGDNALPSGGTYRVRAGNAAANTDGTVRIGDATASPNLSLGRRIAIHGQTGNGSVVKFSIADFPASKSGYVRFNVILGNATGAASNAGSVNGTNFYFFIGNGNDYTTANTFTNNQTMFGLQGSFSNNLVNFNYRNSGNWVNTNLANANPGRTISQGTKYTIEIYYNNTTAAIDYHRLGTNSLATNAVDMWINHAKVNTNNIRNTGSGSPYGNDQNIDSFQFIVQDDNGAAFIDDLEYSNALPSSANVTLNSVQTGDLSNSLNFIATNGPLAVFPNTSFTNAAFRGYDLNINSGHNVAMNVANANIRNVTIASTGSLTGTSNDPNSPIYLRVFGDITNNGTLGGALARNLGIDVSVGNRLISGSGTTEIATLRALDDADVSDINLTIDKNITCHYNNNNEACLFSNKNRPGAKFNVTVNAGKTVTLMGGLSIDGNTGSGTQDRGGVYTINGTMEVGNKLYLTTNNTNTSFPCSLVVKNGGILKVGAAGSIVTAASGAATHSLIVNNGGKLQIESNEVPAFMNASLIAGAPTTTNNIYSFDENSNITIKGNASDALPSTGVFPIYNLTLDGGTVQLVNDFNPLGNLSLINNSLLEFNFPSTRNYTIGGEIIINNSTLDLNISSGAVNLLATDGVTIENGGILKLSSSTSILIVNTDLLLDGIGSKIIGDFNLSFRSKTSIQNISFTNGATPSLVLRNLTFNNTSVNTTQRRLNIKGGNVTVNNALTLTQGSIYTDTNKIILGSNASINGENNSHRIIGYIETTRPSSQNINQTFGGLGLQINARGANPNSFKVLRTTGPAAEAVNQNNVNAKSALRRFKITDYDNAGSLNADVVFSYLENELNGIPEGNIQLIRSTDGGITWLLAGNGNLNVSANTVSLTGVNQFSEWTIQNQNEPLPVTLSYFTGKTLDNGNFLQWQTLSEVNNLGFNIMRKTETDEKFESIAFVKGNINSNVKKNYLYMDSFKGNAYYQLQQIDMDGTTSESPIVHLQKHKTLTHLSLYPNPVKDKLTIQFSGLNLNDEIFFSLSNATGKTVLKQNLKAEQLAEFLNLHFSSLTKGVYFLSIQGEVFSTTQKLIKE